MPHFTKPAEGSWTEHYGIETGPVSYEDSISPGHYELERDAIFRRTWLNVGRVEQVPKTGSYFTRELDDGPHLGGRRARRERRGARRPQHLPPPRQQVDVERLPPRGGERHLPAVHLQYHGWRYSLDGDLTFVQQEPEFFDLDRSDFGLAPVRCEVWEGFVFVNLDNDDKTPLRDYLGGLAEGIAGYPFHRMTQVHKYRAEIGSNRRLFIDAFAEFYHAPVLHAKQSVVDESRKLQGVGFEALAYDVDGPHSMVSSWGGTSPPKDLSMGHDARSGDPGGDDRGGRVRCDTRQSGMLAHHVGQPSAPDGLVRPVRRRRCRG